MILEFFPPVALAMQDEIAANHPVLAAQLASLNPSTQLEDRVALIGVYCNVALDGYYFDEEIETVFHLLLKRLREKGTIILQ